METTNTVANKKKPMLVRAFHFVLLASAAAVLCATALLYGLDWVAQQKGKRQAALEESHAISAENPAGPDTFYPRQVVARPPLVTDFKAISIDEAGGLIDDDELVLGVSIEGEARAYPLNMMTNPDREVFNDELGGRAIAATW